MDANERVADLKDKLLRARAMRHVAVSRGRRIEASMWEVEIDQLQHWLWNMTRGMERRDAATSPAR